MVFTDIVARVMDRLNLTSDSAQTRIGIFVNDRYKHVVSSIGLNTTAQINLPFTVDATDPVTAAILPDFAVTGFQKILRIKRPVNNDTGGVMILKEMTWDEVTSMATGNELPRAWAVKRTSSDHVLITFDSFPDPTNPTAGNPFTMDVMGYELTIDLVDNVEPAFPRDFHDVLVHGAIADELRKMEKEELSMAADKKFEDRLTDLRMFLAKSAYLDLEQGKDKPSTLWYRPWFTRVSSWE